MDSPAKKALRMLLFRRNCVECPSSTGSCPTCADGEQCQMVLQTCDACASYVCTKTSSSSTASATATAVAASKSNNAGAIAGGVVGGVVVILAVAMFLLWRFYYKPRKVLKDQMTADAEKEGNPSQTNRLSTETLTSLAPSNFARSSNIIPIAYIPGVTTRAPQQQQDVDRSSIATTNYRGSTAVISSAMMTAITARPNLVAISRSDDKNDAVPATIGTGSRAVYAKPRQTAHSITIGSKGTGLQSTFIEEDDEEEDEEGEDDSVVETVNKQPSSQATVVTAPKVVQVTSVSGPRMVAPKIVNLTKPRVTNPATTIDHRVSSASAASFKSATSGPKSAQDGSNNPFEDAVAGGSVKATGSSTSNELTPKGTNYFSGTLKDLDGRISPFDDHYKL